MLQALKCQMMDRISPIRRGLAVESYEAKLATRDKRLCWCDSHKTNRFGYPLRLACAIICAELGDLTCARDIWTQLVGTSPGYAPARVNLRILDSLDHSSEAAGDHGF